MKKMSPLYKISYSALFIALGIILSRFFALPMLFGLSFLKLSLTMSVIFFASFYLGPLYGTIVSFSIDLFGALLFPQGGSYDFLYSVPAIIEGFLPYFIYKLVEKLKVDKKYPIVLGILLLLLDVFILLFVLLHDKFSFTLSGKEYDFSLTLKILIPSIFISISIIFYVLIIIFKNRFKKLKFNNYYNVYYIVIAMIITYLFKNSISSLISVYRLNYSFEIIFGTKTLLAFISMFVHFLIVSLCLSLSLMNNYKGALIVNKRDENEGEIDDRKQ